METVVRHRVRKKRQFHPIELETSGFQKWLYIGLHSWQHHVEVDKQEAKTYPRRRTYAKRTVRYRGTGRYEAIRKDKRNELQHLLAIVVHAPLRHTPLHFVSLHTTAFHLVRFISREAWGRPPPSFLGENYFVLAS